MMVEREELGENIDPISEEIEKELEFLPDISVIVATFNHDKWIERCIRSLSHQRGLTSREYEIIVIDDGSTDHTKEVLQNLIGLSNLRVLTNRENQGLPVTLNRAIQLARGRYVVRVDSDDYVSRDFLRIMRLFLDMNRHYQAVAIDYVCVDENENVLRRANCFEEEIACGIMFRKECLFDIGLYDPDFQMREGHELRVRFEEQFRVAHLELPFYKYRNHGTNRTKNKEELARFDERLRKLSDQKE